MGQEMTVAILVMAVLPALLAAAGAFDLMSYTIPNIIPAAMIVLFISFMIIIALSGGGVMSWSEIGLHLLGGIIGLAAGMALFAAGWIGGGDAKLFAAALLWLGWDALLDYTITASVLGGVLTLALLALRQVPLPAFLVKQSWFRRLSDQKAGVPYGVALAVAALLVLPDTRIFQIASAS
jgi:prepilin peptidase CpaA